MQEKRPRGRPEGSGAQLPAVERIRQSRASRAAAGSTRFDITLDADYADKLNQLAAYWQCRSRKEAIEKAIAAAFFTVHPRQS